MLQAGGYRAGSVLFPGVIFCTASDDFILYDLNLLSILQCYDTQSHSCYHCLIFYKLKLQH